MLKKGVFLSQKSFSSKFEIHSAILSIVRILKIKAANIMSIIQFNMSGEFDEN
jgi:hypothetical protein